MSTNGIEMFFETFGDAHSECVVLLSGIGQQLIDWDERFCLLLAQRGYRVIRLDNRDSGLSTHFDEESPSYSLDDMAADTLGLLDVLECDSAHLMGVSMGGMIAQIMAIRDPKRVKSLTLISTNTGNHSVGQAAPDIQANPFPHVSGDALDNAYASSSRWASFELGTTEEALRERLRRRLMRDHTPGSVQRQLQAILAAPDRTRALTQFDVPTTVIHGDKDPMVDVSGGQALAAAIPNARLVLIPDLRHDIPESVWPQLFEALPQ